MQSAQTPAVAFPDANIFLEYRRLDDPAWRAAFEERPLVFEVCVHTVSEVDAKRNSPRARLRKRAQATSSWLLSVSDGTGLLDNGANIEFVSGSPVALLDRGDFDRHNPDDVLVASALKFKQENPEREVWVLSEDTGVVLKARGFGLFARQPPLELRLAAEPSDEDRRIEHLQSRVNELEMGSPRVMVACEGNPTHVSVNAAHDFEADFVGGLIERERQACSRAAPNQVESYLKEYEAYAHELYRWNWQIARAFEVPLTISNENGHAPAIGVHLQLTAPAEVAFCAKLPESPREPTPPIRKHSFAMGYELPLMNTLPDMIARPWENVGDWEIARVNQALITIRKLVHGRCLVLPRLFASFAGAAGNFNVSWIAHVENNRSPFEGILHFTVDEDRDAEGLTRFVEGLRG
jgi:hypothetical protein